MELKTKRVLFASLLNLGAGLVLSGIGAGIGMAVLLYIGIAVSLFGIVGTTASSVKGAFEQNKFNNTLKNRETLVEKSFDPVIENTTSKEIETETKLYTTKSKLESKTTQTKEETLDL